MADGRSTGALTALGNGKGAVLAGVAVLASVWLLHIAGRDSKSRSASLASMAAMAQETGATSPIATGTVPAAPATDKTGTFSPDQVKAMQAIIKDYLMANPEILRDVSQELERKQAAEQAAKAERFLVDNKAKVFTSSGDFILGNPKGDITVVEFFDYNCGWCKRAVDDIMKLTKADPRVRVVMKEYPIFGGPPSVQAAKAAMASIKQGKYWEFHTALMREKQVSEQNLFAVAQKVGLDVNRLKADMNDKKLETTIEQNVQVGQELGIEGTPGFLIDSRINVGYVAADGMQKMIGEIRKAGCKIC